MGSLKYIWCRWGVKKKKKIETDGKSEGDGTKDNIDDKMDVDGDKSLNGNSRNITVADIPSSISVDSAEDSEDSEKDVLALDDKEKNNTSKINDIVQAVVLSSSFDEEDEGDSSSNSKMCSAQRSTVVSDSEGISNGATSTNASRLEEDDEKPVSIPSDSDEKDDCIMIDDDKNDNSKRNRKNAVEMRNYQDFEDDIEDIVDDPLDTDTAQVATRIKLNNTTMDLSTKSNGSSSN